MLSLFFHILIYFVFYFVNSSKNVIFAFHIELQLWI